MATRKVELLLIETVENLGIVGDVVKVRPGYARNFLLPHGLAERPSKKRLDELQERRKQVQAEIAAQRKAREALHAKMSAIEVAIIRSCNDQGMLYGSVSQRDISDALREAGYDVEIRAVRLGQPIKRVGSYPVPIQFDRDLRTEITLRIDPDHPIGEEREEMEFDNEGRLIRKPKGAPKSEGDKPADAEQPSASDEKPRRKGRSKTAADEPAAAPKSEAKSEPAKEPKASKKKG
jgi:large subunit ribosomal protein L9